ncbi:uncharacterized protein LOC135430527 [Drosophila montana]|uniref:uncharacterized protein LOC135430527 n=1 Tax=Drosophila montana TaxID=40370 RepID=UPI00313DA8F4
MCQILNQTGTYGWDGLVWAWRYLWPGLGKRLRTRPRQRLRLRLRLGPGLGLGLGLRRVVMLWRLFAVKSNDNVGDNARKLKREGHGADTDRRVGAGGGKTANGAS